MSEPFSAVAQVTIDRDALITYLDAPPRPASGWSDWRRIGGEWHSFSWDKDLPGILTSVDRRLAGSYRHVIRHLIAPDMLPGAERCAYEPATRRFTFATLMLSENIEELVLFCAAARGLTAYMSDADAGLAVVQDYLWSKTPHTMAALQIGPADRSEFLDAQADAAAYARHAGAAIAVFDDIKAAAGAPGRVIDELDQLR